jgi:hypothetical protein
MNISELIYYLIDLKNKNGDLLVQARDKEGTLNNVDITPKIEQSVDVITGKKRKVVIIEP